jgi:CDP-diglyceride synthetase
MESNGKYYIENLPIFVEQISKNSTLLMFIIGLLFSIGISVPLAVTISKVINPVSRSLADVCRTVIIWSLCLVLTVTLGK